jgi:hypothetical protein
MITSLAPSRTCFENGAAVVNTPHSSSIIPGALGKGRWSLKFERA